MASTMSYVAGQPQFEPDKPPFRTIRTIWSAPHPAFGLAQALGWFIVSDSPWLAFYCLVIITPYFSYLIL